MHVLVHALHLHVDQGADQRLLAREVLVERLFADAHLARELGHDDAADAELARPLLEGGEDAIARRG